MMSARRRRGGARSPLDVNSILTGRLAHRLKQRRAKSRPANRRGRRGRATATTTRTRARRRRSSTLLCWRDLKNGNRRFHSVSVSQKSRKCQEYTSAGYGCTGPKSASRNVRCASWRCTRTTAPIRSRTRRRTGCCGRATTWWVSTTTIRTMLVRWPNSRGIPCIDECSRWRGPTTLVMTRVA